MEKSFIFNSINGDRKMKAEDFREIFIPFFKNGVFPNPATGLQVISSINMNIAIQHGRAFINGALYLNTEDLILTLDPADGVLDRIDLIVLRMDTLERNIRCVVKKGDYASSPVPKQLQRDADAYELCLAQIYISKGTININQSSINDTRLNTEVCGIVAGTVDEIDTTELYRQLQEAIIEKGLSMETWVNEAKEFFTNEFNTWFDTIKGALDGDVAGNLLNEINKLKEAIAGMELTSTKVTRPNGKTVEESISANETSIQNNKYFKFTKRTRDK